MVRGVGVLVGLGMVCALSSAQSLLVNGGFEEPVHGPASECTGWEVWRGSGLPTSGRRVNEPVASGRWALFIQMMAHGGSQIVEQGFAGYVPGQLYEVAFQARSREPYDAFRVSVIDRSPTLRETATLVSEAFTNLGWTAYAVRFNAPDEAGHPLWVRLQAIGPKPDSGAWFDDVSILPVSAAAAEFSEVQARVENESFNVLVSLEFDLRTQLDVIGWLLRDLREFEVADAGQVAALQERLDALDTRITEELDALSRVRGERLLSGALLWSLTDEQIADRARQVATLLDDLSRSAGEVRSEFTPGLQELAADADALQGHWQPPAQEPVRYHPRMLAQRFHRIISYSPQRMPVSEYMRRSLLELQPTLIIGNPHLDYADLNRPAQR
ncbi:MAG: hypothetical protein AB7Y46_10275 [Armatimonadota bacterium]